MKCQFSVRKVKVTGRKTSKIWRRIYLRADQAWQAQTAHLAYDILPETLVNGMDGRIQCQCGHLLLKCNDTINIVNYSINLLVINLLVINKNNNNNNNNKTRTSN